MSDCTHEPFDDDEDGQEVSIATVYAIPHAYPLQALDVLFIGLRLGGNLLMTLAGGVHAVADEIAAAANFRRNVAVEEATREEVARQAAIAMGILEEGSD